MRGHVRCHDRLIEREAESMGAYRVLTKPIRLATIRETVMQGLWEVYGWTMKSA